MYVIAEFDYITNITLGHAIYYCLLWATSQIFIKG